MKIDPYVGSMIFRKSSMPQASHSGMIINRARFHLPDGSQV
ncbi:hypothetical protein U3A58_08505 [Algoriphagus sp. C2-6-M1]|nr:hypothetical protein [Algoriphagus sp. C2-6-M1]MEB2780434.1 hypothetical protein [Algoriphagus sp. C2-6-M1]